MKIIIVIVFVIIWIDLFAQETQNSLSLENQSILIKKTKKECYNKKSIEPFNVLVNSNKIVDLQYKQDIIIERARCFFEIDSSFEHNEIRDTALFNKKITEVLEIYQSAYDISDYELLKHKAIYFRYEFLKEIVTNYKVELPNKIINQYNKDLMELKINGMIPERDGLGLGINYVQSEEKWIGGEFALFSFYKPVVTFFGVFEGKDSRLRASNKNDKSANALVLGYGHSLNSKTHDVSFSLIEINSPFVLIPAKFGFQTYNNKAVSYYRPTLGLALGPFSVSYAYNLVFLKKNRSLIDRHLWIVKFIFPITNHRNKAKK